MNELESLRKEVLLLRKKCQKLESNIIKNSSANRIDIPCNCENPHYTQTTATKTNKICTYCAGV
jgi:hypothetical protein